MIQGLTRNPRPVFWLALIGCLVMTLGVAAIGAWVTAGSVDTWYPMLVKPAINPPNWVFGPVWTILYIMMALAAALVWSGRQERNRRSAIAWFFVQLALNLGWSILFFGMHRIGSALICLAMLWGAIAVTACYFWRLSKAAALLMVPYLLWVAFAGLLNFLIWQLN